MIRDLLDLDLLRTFMLAADLESFAKAADRIARSQSAVSLQMQRLEEMAGKPLFLKQGRSWQLTPAGELLLGYARQMLDVNDRAIQALQDTHIEGHVRLGLLADFAESGLPVVLARFAGIYPNVRIEVKIDRQAVLQQLLQSGKLDVIINYGRQTPALALPVGRLPMRWIGSAATAITAKQPLPLLLFESPCLFRKAGLEALELARRPWRETLTSPSLAGLWAAAQAGLGITLRTEMGLPAGCKVLTRTSGLPALPVVHIFLLKQRKAASPAAGRLTEILLETLREQVEEIRKR